SVTDLSISPFYDCTNLTNISVDESNQVYSSLNGVLFDKAQVTLIQFPIGRRGSYTIPNTVTHIGFEAFNWCGLTSVTMGSSVTSIGKSAFSSCVGLTNATIPDSVITLEDHAFSYCSSLISVTIPNN